jgi:hypothetical protein
MSITPAYSQNQTCTLYGLTSGRCIFTVYDIESSSQFNAPSTVAVSLYTTLTPGDFAVVPITAVNGDTGLLSSVAQCAISAVRSAPTSAGTSITSNTGPTGTATNAESPITNSHAASGLSPGEKAGIGIGVGLGGVIILGVGALLLYRRSKQDRSPPQLSEAGEVGVGKAGTQSLHELGQEEKEMPTGKEAHEMPSPTIKAELAANREN